MKNDIANIILFDGICNLCNSSVQFVVKHDSQHIFKFASLQSNAGQALLQQLHLPRNNFNSFVLIENNKIYLQSTAALRVVYLLGGLLRLLYVFMIVPAFIRNGIYEYIANHRYKWFGHQESCWIPTPELRERFLT